MQEWRIIKALAPLIRTRRRALAAMFGLGLLEALTEGLGISLFLPLFSSLDPTASPELEPLAARLDALFAAVPAEDRLAVIAVLIFGLVVLRSALAYTNGVLFGWADARITHDLRCRVFDQLQNVNLRFLERYRIGRLRNTLENQTRETSDAVMVLCALAINLATIVIFLGLLTFLSWRATLGVVVALGLISVILRLLTRRLEVLSRYTVDSEETLEQRILEALRGMRTVRIFGRERHERRRFASASWRLSLKYWQRERLEVLIQPVAEVMVAGLLMLVLYAMLRGDGSLPLVLTFLLVLFRLQPQVSNFDEARAELVSAGAPVEDVMAFLERRDKPYIRSGPLAFDGLRDAIELAGVDFRYEDEGPPALRDVSLRIEKGQTTAIVGRSGAGKSTLLHLLLRFDDPTAGEIRVDGVPLPQLDLRTWRRSLAMVSQAPHLFDATVAENIAYGRLGASRTEVVEAARLAAADGFIRALPRGYDTRIGDHGVRLSGGQRQRLALARALVRDPEILILDEATNALDTLAEETIHGALRELAGERTVIVVAHRLATVEAADRVIVLDGGRVVEAGAPGELLADRKLFARLHGRSRTLTSKEVA